MNNEELIIVTPESNIPKTRTRKAFLRNYLATCPATFFEDGSIQCTPKRKRSVSDLLAMTQNRFKKTSVDAVMRILGELHEEGRVQLIWCNMVQKPVIKSYYDDPFRKEKPFVTNYSRQAYYEVVGVDGYSLKMLDDIRKKELNGKR